MRVLARTVLVVLFATVIASLTAVPAVAQHRLSSEREDLRQLRGDVWSVITSPVRADRHAVLPALAAVAATAAAMPIDSATYAWMLAHPRSPLLRAIAPVRENFRVPLYELGSALFLIPMSGALYTGGRLGDEPNVRDAGSGCMAAELSSSALRILIQLSVNRDRPRESRDPFHISPVWSGRYKGHSFPSGHVENPMACSTFLAYRFDLGAAEPAMFVYVATLALARVADGQHWPSDVVAGAALGWGIGKALADRQDQRGARGGRGSARRADTFVIPLWSRAF